MLKLIVPLLCLTSLIGCSSTNSKIEYKAPYCYTDETIVTANNKVNSSTTVQCTDRPGQQTMIQRAGIDANCREFEMMEPRWGTLVPVRGVRCKKYDGTWEILNLNGYAR